ncbi:MAG: hypothetical protein JJ934_13740 [Pseudomonadales bacterium]|nr:hypothetical protein [Pseudomonadales bacterium]MBO6563537.1 hypothetical protein [Pseudomonadales bacterium]MBO6596851.1 hypothetical protein [Pseudomonadales bacterium]MBO6657958.1 hypothetical protein [Pseudomonadales bacterium]MBO6703522.1 hypothetical protein [Pseudomonadales bacterium]
MQYPIRKPLFAILIAILISCSSQAALFGKKEKTAEEKAQEIAEEQQAIRDMRSETLQELYRLSPEAKEDAMNSEAVAVFSSLGMNLFLVSTARGGGIVRETKTGKETFMRMFSAGGGFGLGVKDFRVIFLFHSQTAYQNFLNSGWDFSGQGDAAAKAGEEGLALEIAATITQGTSIYQITENGLALQATLQGTKYYLDKELN